MTQSNTYLSTKDAAEYLGLKPNTLAHWRSQGKNNIPYVRFLGRKVFYELEELEKFKATMYQKADQ